MGLGVTIFSMNNFKYLDTVIPLGANGTRTYGKPAYEVFCITFGDKISDI